MASVRPRFVTAGISGGSITPGGWRLGGAANYPEWYVYDRESCHAIVARYSQRGEVARKLAEAHAERLNAEEAEWLAGRAALVAEMVA